MKYVESFLCGEQERPDRGAEHRKSMVYVESFLCGLRSLPDQRALFIIFVKAVLDEMGVEVSKMLRVGVAFEWRGDELAIRGPRAGDDLALAKLTLADDQGDDGQWAPILCVTVVDGCEKRCWEANEDDEVETIFKRMLEWPSVARSIAKMGGLRAADDPEHADSAPPPPEGASE